MNKLILIFGIIVVLGLGTFFLDPTKYCKVLINETPWKIEIVDSPETVRRGLMYRKNLCGNCGMLFIFPNTLPRTFWMKNTLIPLNIYFFDESGVVVDKAISMRPEKETNTPMKYTSKSAKYVLEVNSNTTIENIDLLSCFSK